MAPKRESIAVNLPQSRNAETEMPKQEAGAGMPKREAHCEICAAGKKSAKAGKKSAKAGRKICQSRKKFVRSGRSIAKSVRSG